MTTRILHRFISNKRLIAPLEFVLNMLLVYGAWKVFRHFAESESCFLHPYWQNFTERFGVVMASLISSSLNLIGIGAQNIGRNVFLTEVTSTGLFVADHCLAIPAMVIFSGFVLLFRGSWQHKLWFVPLGCVLIQLINIIRLAALTYISAHFSEDYFRINHEFIYVFFTYGLIFLLVMWWMNRFSEKTA